MRVKRIAALIALLCTSILCAGNVLADDDEPLKSDVLDKKENDMVPKTQEITQMKTDEISEKDGNSSSVNGSISQVDDESNIKPSTDEMHIMEGMQKMPPNAIDDQVENENEAEILAQPGMRRLARYLRNFHNRLIFHAHPNAIFAQRRAAAKSDEDENAIAEERAVRRRKRIRRRNIKDKVKRRNHNRNEANRNKSSRRNLNNRTSTKQKNTSNSSRKDNKSVRRQNTRKSSRRRASTKNRHKGSSKGPSRKQSTKNKNKNKKTKNKKTKNKARKNKNQNNLKRPNSNFDYQYDD